VDGAVAGGQIGYNYQVNQWVFGVEGEMAWSNVKGGVSAINANGPASWNTDVKWVATLAGRIGYAFDNVLLYGKGGVAWADQDYDHPALSGGGAQLDYTGSETRFGWLLGAGVEYGFTPNWSAKVEYDYIDFGSKDITLNDPSGRWVTFGMDQKMQIVKVGVNYRF
jgi:outer membrane immunogenic protein